MMPGVSHRSARIAREEDLVYTTADGQKKWVIPRGTPIGMTSMINHYNETLFPHPDEYSPERWLLENGQVNYALEKNLIAFGRGTRNCVGLQYVSLWYQTSISKADLTKACVLRTLHHDSSNGAARATKSAPP